MEPTSSDPASGVQVVEWMTMQQAAEHIGVSVRTVHRYVEDASVPLTRHRPLPGMIRLRADEVDAIRRIRLGFVA